MHNQLDLLSVIEAEQSAAAVAVPPTAGAHARTKWAQEVRRAYEQRYLPAVIHELPCLPWEVRSWDFGRGFQGEVALTERCIATLLSVDVYPPDWGPGIAGCGGVLYRSACTGCPWEGEPTIDEDLALAGACDHAWPGWRDLPIVDRRQSLKPEHWLDQLEDDYEAVMPGWRESGAPIRTRRDGPVGTRSHWSAEVGRYDMCAEVAGVVIARLDRLRQGDGANPPGVSL
jgi:hypothetical protein